MAADLRPCALITQAGTDRGGRVALLRRACLVEISSAPDAKAGLFTLMEDDGRGSPRRSAPAARRCCC